MNLNDLLSGLTEKQKRKLAEAKTSEELDALAGPDVIQLSDGALDSVSGGGCFKPSYSGCCNCGYPCTIIAGDPCPSCGEIAGLFGLEDIGRSADGFCMYCGMPLVEGPFGSFCPHCIPNPPSDVDLT